MLKIPNKLKGGEIMTTIPLDPYQNFSKEELIERVRELEQIVDELNLKRRVDHDKFAQLALVIAELQDKLKIHEETLDASRRRSEYWYDKYHALKECKEIN